MINAQSTDGRLDRGIGTLEAWGCSSCSLIEHLEHVEMTKRRGIVTVESFRAAEHVLFHVSCLLSRSMPMWHSSRYLIWPLLALHFTSRLPRDQECMPRDKEEVQEAQS